MEVWWLLFTSDSWSFHVIFEYSYQAHGPFSSSFFFFAGGHFILSAVSCNYRIVELQLSSQLFQILPSFVQIVILSYSMFAVTSMTVTMAITVVYLLNQHKNQVPAEAHLIYLSLSTINNL